MTAHLTTFQRALARRLRAKGMSLRDIAKEVGCSHSGIDVMLRGQSREVKPDVWTPRAGCLTVSDREEILLGLHRNESMSSIARALDKLPSTVTREVKANGGRDSYSIWPAHVRAREDTQRHKPWKLVKGPLCDKVTMWLKKLWSPEEVTNRLRHDQIGDPSMQVSHETIYQSLYVQGRGELRRELASHIGPFDKRLNQRHFAATTGRSHISGLHSAPRSNEVLLRYRTGTIQSRGSTTRRSWRQPRQHRN